MKKLKSSIVWELCFVIFGIILICNAVGFFNVNLFFKGWWTLFIIIPAIQGLFVKGSRTNNLFLLLIGIALLIGTQGMMSAGTLWTIIFGGALIIFGVSSIYNSMKNKEDDNVSLENHDFSEDCNAFFSGQKKVCSGQKFTGQNLRAIFGGIVLDLSNAIIDQDVRINIIALFGGCEISVPRNVNIKTSGTNFMGGIDDSHAPSGNPEFPTIHVYASTLFGGVKIK